MSDETKKGHTPIHVAAQNGHVQVVNEFAKHNVNLRMVISSSSVKGWLEYFLSGYDFS